MSAIQGSGLEGCLHFRGLDKRGSTVLHSPALHYTTAPSSIQFPTVPVFLVYG